MAGVEQLNGFFGVPQIALYLSVLDGRQELGLAGLNGKV